MISTRRRLSRLTWASSRVSVRRFRKSFARRPISFWPTLIHVFNSTFSTRSTSRSSSPDTMNFWIQSRRPDILELLGHVDLVTLNDAEARQLTERPNLVQAAQWIMSRGPRHVIIKKGEHGAFMFTEKSVFFAPAFPLENVFDPTGAGDAFAGGFIGYLAKTGDLSE